VWWLALIAVAGCGRVNFGAPPELSIDASVGDGAADTGPLPFDVHHVQVFVGRNPGPVNTDSFTKQATAGNAVLIYVGCGATAAPTAISVTASGWSFAPITPLFGQAAAQKYGQGFIAFAPNNAPATVNVQVTGGPCTDLIELGDELGADQGTIMINTVTGTADVATQCLGSVTTMAPNDTVWAACHAGSTPTSIGPGYTLSADDGFGDWAEYKSTMDPANTVESSGFVATTGDFSLLMVTLTAF
jgi:hypothetical protein